MKGFRFRAIAACLLAAGISLRAGSAKGQAATADSTNSVAVQPTQQSPVETFRKLLAMTPGERDQFLRIYPAEIRAGIVRKIQEYQLLPPQLRELRLRVTELRWYLLPLMKTNATARAAQLKLIPEPYQKLVADRLKEWDIWPPQLKQEVLEYETTMHYFVGRGQGAPVLQRQMVVDDVPEAERSELERKLAQFAALPATQREQMYARFSRYFDFTDSERQKILDTLSQTERENTEKALDPIEKWPKQQQEQYIAAFRQYANMTPQERQQFMKNAERWQNMSPQERQAWRDLVEHLSKTPPFPIGFHPASGGTVSVAGPAVPSTN